ncbi:MAG: M15 family metallopeptidase [Steroidobacteraceae bacterium]
MSALLHQLAEEFSIPVSTLLGRHRISYPEAQDLAVAEVGQQGREHLLMPEAAQAWQQMQRAALSDGISIFIVSAFRSIERQTQIVRRKLTAGIPIEQILEVSALQGFSEHHTGRAVDVGTPDSAPLEYEFEDTAAFSWLQARAADFDFQLSYPAANQEGYIYEPWHWCYQREAGAAR